MTRANLFVIGAAKAGTTSLASYLDEQSEIYLSPIKEPCHFCPDIMEQLREELARQSRLDLDAYLNSEPMWPIHQHYVENSSHYERLFRNATNLAIMGECSTYYLPSKLAASRIYNYNPNAKIVAILRDPISRIASHYKMDFRTGIERRPLIECITEELDYGDRANYGNCRMYVSQSDYGPQLERYSSLFEPSQLKVVDFDDLTRNTEETLSDILEFLGLPAEHRTLKIPKENATKEMPRFSALDRMLYKSGVKQVLERQLPRILPKKLKKALKNAYIGPVQEEKFSIPDDLLSIPKIQEIQNEYLGIFADLDRPIRSKQTGN